MELIESGFTYNQGRIAINNMFSGGTPFYSLNSNTISASTFFSGSTNFYDIFQTIGGSLSSTTIQNGLNIYTGGTAASPTINISAATLNTLNVTGVTELGALSASTLNISLVESGTSETRLCIDSLGNIVSENNLFQNLVDAPTIVWGYDLGTKAKVTINGNRTLQITGMTDGSSGILIIKQGTGENTITLPSHSKVANGGGGTVLLSSSANEEDILSFIYQGTEFYWNIGYNYN